MKPRDVIELPDLSEHKPAEREPLKPASARLLPPSALAKNNAASPRINPTPKRLETQTVLDAPAPHHEGVPLRMPLPTTAASQQSPLADFGASTPIDNWHVLAYDLCTEGLDPMKHRIVGITVKSKYDWRAIAERDEKKLLERFWRYVQQGHFDTLVGFNNGSFDNRFLHLRSVKHAVQSHISEMRVIDLREVMSFGQQAAKGKLSDYAALLDLHFPESRWCKHNMSILWRLRPEDVPGLEEFLLRDTETVWALYEHAKLGGLLCRHASTAKATTSRKTGSTDGRTTKSKSTNAASASTSSAIPTDCQDANSPAK